MVLQQAIGEARKRQACKELERAFLAQFGEEVEGWLRPVFSLCAEGLPEVRITHNGRQIAVWCDTDGVWYVEGEALAFDWRDPDEARDALLVAIDDLAPAQPELAAGT